MRRLAVVELQRAAYHGGEGIGGPAFDEAVDLGLGEAGAPQVFMGGTFSQYSLAYGPLGQYSVVLTR